MDRSLVSAHPVDGASPASGTGFVLVGEPFFSDPVAAYRESIGYAQYEFGVLPEDYDDIVNAIDDGDDDVDIVICTGCGVYADGSRYGQEHACWVNPDGSREVGGSFQ